MNSSCFDVPASTSSCSSDNSSLAPMELRLPDTASRCNPRFKGHFRGHSAGYASAAGVPVTQTSLRSSGTTGPQSSVKPSGHKRTKSAGNNHGSSKDLSLYVATGLYAAYKSLEYGMFDPRLNRSSMSEMNVSSKEQNLPPKMPANFDGFSESKLIVLQNHHPHGGKCLETLNAVSLPLFVH